jgi:hypothetical protein
MKLKVELKGEELEPEAIVKRRNEKRTQSYHP